MIEPDPPEPGGLSFPPAGVQLPLLPKFREGWLRPALFFGNNPASQIGGAITTASAMTLIGFWVVDSWRTVTIGTNGSFSRSHCAAYRRSHHHSETACGTKWRRYCGQLHRIALSPSAAPSGFGCQDPDGNCKAHPQSLARKYRAIVGQSWM
jgi:hypothetical protein